MLGVQLRASFQLSRMHLERGDLAESSKTAHEGLRLAEQAGLGLAPYGLDLKYTHYLAHYFDGDWEHALQVADGFVVRVTNVAEARLSAMALFIDVARGSPKVTERLVWLRPFWPADGFGAYIARGLLAEHLLWQGDTEAAIAEIDGDHQRDWRTTWAARGRRSSARPRWASAPTPTWPAGPGRPGTRNAKSTRWTRPAS